MEKEQETIEVEVVAIDGIAPVPVTPHHEEEAPRDNWQDWQKWQGRIRRLDARWWPLWVFLGVILVFLLLSIGVVFGVIYLVYRIARNFLVGIASAFRAG